MCYAYDYPAEEKANAAMADLTESSKLSYHDRRLARRLEEDPEFAAEFHREQRETAVIDSIVNKLDDLRERSGLSKAQLAREIGKHPASVRRLLTAPTNPELRTVVALADALDADIQVVPRRSVRRRPAA